MVETAVLLFLTDLSFSGTDVDEDTLALYGMALDQQAQLFMASNRLREAEKSFREAVLVATKLHGEKGEQVLVVTNSLATVLRYAMVSAQCVTE